MTSKHYRWQARWRLDVRAGLALHETGLRMRLDARRGAVAVAENREEILAQLIPKHGGHNAPQMLRRLEREALRLYRLELDKTAASAAAPFHTSTGNDDANR